MEIYGTLGPACANAEVLKAMFEEGMTGMRLNLSHGSLEDSREMIEAFHKGAQAAGAAADLLIDMQGPELRIGILPEEVKLTEGEYIVLREDAGIPQNDASSETSEQEKQL